MISQSCPRCHSQRIRRGYRPTPVWSKFLFRFNLLCDGCNWEFKGFAVPGTVSAKSSKKRKPEEDEAPKISNLSLGSEDKSKVKKRIRVKF